MKFPHPIDFGLIEPSTYPAKNYFVCRFNFPIRSMVLNKSEIVFDVHVFLGNLETYDRLTESCYPRSRGSVLRTLLVCFFQRSRVRFSL